MYCSKHGDLIPIKSWGKDLETGETFLKIVCPRCEQQRINKIMKEEERQGIFKQLEKEVNNDK